MSVESVKQRYFRKTIAHPEGSVVHDGDCRFFDMHLCTCGLLHELIWIQNDVEQIYPAFWEEWGKQQGIMEQLHSIAHEGGTLKYAANEPSSGAYPVPAGPGGPVDRKQLSDIEVANLLKDILGKDQNENS